MGRLLILGLILLLTLPLVAGNSAGLPIFFADSYMMRARGVEANYWNPALLNRMGELWLPALNTGISFNNNALDLKYYNHIMDNKEITESDKEELLNRMGGSLRFNAKVESSIVGFCMGDAALSSSLHLFGKAKLSQRYLDLLLYGNEEEHYEFSKKDTNVESLGYIDLTVGMGDIRLPLPESIPDIRFGWSGSLLFGVEELDTAHYSGIFTSNYDGLSLKQDVTLRASAGGLGFKGMIGLASEPIQNLHAGITLDNILGGIRWGLMRESLHYSISAENVYILDLDDDDNDLFEVDEWEEQADPFTTKLPMEMRMGLLYRLKLVDFSIDYVQGFGDSVVTSKVGRVSFGSEFSPLYTLPIYFGFSPGNSDGPYQVAFGLGLRTRVIALGLGVQSFGSLFPSSKSKGIATALSLRIKY